MRRSPFLVTAAAVAILSLGACAGGTKEAKSEEDIHASLSEHFQTDGLSEKQADCYADLVIDEVGVDALKDAEVGDKEPPTKQQAAYAKAALRAVDECEIDKASLSG